MKRIEHTPQTCPICGGSDTAALARTLSTATGKALYGHWCKGCSPHKEQVIFETVETLPPGITERLLTQGRRKTAATRQSNRTRRTKAAEARRVKAQREERAAGRDIAQYFE